MVFGERDARPWRRFYCSMPRWARAMEIGRMRHLKAGIIFLLMMLTFVNYIQQDVFNPQQITRLALTLAITEGKLTIDDYAALTVDRAEFDGHAYADKPPGLSLLAVPAVWLTRQLLGAPTGVLDQQHFASAMLASILSTVALLASLAAAALYLLCRRLGVSDGAALFASCALALATPFLGWSTTFFAHSATGSVLLLALSLAAWGRQKPKWWIASFLGLLLGLLLTIDLVSAPAAAAVGLFYLSGRWSAVWARLAGAVMGGIAGLLPLLVYNAAAFGSPLTLGYSRVVGFEGMKEGLFGLTWPNPAVAAELLFGLYRGLLPLSPVLLLLPLGWVRMWREPSLRPLALVTLAIVAAFLLINASYHYWDGGSSTGPRHLVGMLPAAGLVLAYAWPAGTMARVVALGLLAVSILFSAACASLYMFADVRFPAPLFDPILPTLFSEGYWPRMLYVLIPVAGFVLLARLREQAVSPTGGPVVQLAPRPAA